MSAKSNIVMLHLVLDVDDRVGKAAWGAVEVFELLSSSRVVDIPVKCKDVLVFAFAMCKCLETWYLRAIGNGERLIYSTNDESECGVS